MNHSSFRYLSACLWVLVFAITSQAKATTPPNIIFIMADDLGYGDLGCYGQQDIATPHIDRLAAQGMRFTQFYAGSTVCAPSRCVLMTGKDTGHCLIRGNAREPLRPGDVTLAEVLKTSGYRTGLIGKWGLGEEGSTGTPNRQGFDYFFGYLNQHHAHNYYPTFLYRNEKRIKLKNVVPHEDPQGGGKASEKIEYSHDLFATEALQFIERNKDDSFFLYLALTIPHANNEAGREGMEVPDDGPYADKDWPQVQKHTAAMITRMDGDVGRIMNKLKDLNIDENTIVFFTSDNGPHGEGGNDPKFFDSNGPLRGIKRALYEGGIRVPLIVRWPQRIKPGTTSDFIGSFIDVLPTCGIIGGAQLPDHLNGLSFLPTLSGLDAQQEQHDYLYWEFHEQGGRQAVRQGDWKAVRQNAKKNPDGPIALYNLREDPSEAKDIAEEHTDIVAKLTAVMTEARTPSEFAMWNFRKDAQP